MEFNEYKNKYKEIFKLHDLLTKAKIPHEFNSSLDDLSNRIIEDAEFRYLKSGYRIKYPSSSALEEVYSAIELYATYEKHGDSIELMHQMNEDEIEHGLTAEEVFDRIKDHWDSVNQIE